MAVSLKRTVSSLLLGTVLLSSLPWEVATELRPTGGDGPAAQASVDGAFGADGVPADLPADDCACLCGMCAVSTHATVQAVALPSAALGGPAPALSRPAPAPHLSAVPKGLFRPPKRG